ncbi:ABC transporter substrate-binding protein [Streptomyces cyanogenus]|uniref:Uncharacterized protein n=1 Tax=Streptomyces cyanogenus TaxID=80860 RepID=A0ABX7TRW8_STRCY|nr:ABC transporter substrate-binding protein [Streptomyces cyanogenus]QTD98368.1 hypothetical protein S1361_13480 [Streptomyces cyanogenus]
MLDSPPGDGQRLVLPAGFDEIVRVIDRYVADRRAGLPRLKRSRASRMPALLLAREPDGDTAAGAAEPDPGLTALVLEYGQRLVSSAGNGTTRHLVSLAPHAVVDDVRPPRGGAREDVAAGPHVLLLADVARQLSASMPERAGALRLPEFNTCLAVLRADIPPGDADEERRALRHLLRERAAGRFEPTDRSGQLNQAVDGKWGTVLQLLAVLPGWLRSLAYGMRLDRRHPWMGRMLGQTGRSFLDAAAELRAAHQHTLAQDAARTPHPEAASLAARDEAVVRQVLLTALIRDLARAARPRVWSRLRPRRGWAFVLLLPTVGGEGSACRKFLDTYAAVVRDTGSSPLLVLGAATDQLPSYAAAPPRRSVPAQGGDPDAHRAGRAAAALFAAAVAGRAADAVHVLPLPRTPDDGTAAERLARHRAVRSRPARRLDWVRPVAAVTAAAVLCAGGFALYRELMAVFFPEPSALTASCRQVPSGEIVGLTDGIDGCDLAHGLYAPDFRDLVRTLGRQNARVDLDRPYRTVVFFAPLSVGSESKRTVPTGFQMLRGALLAQRQVNDRHMKSQVPVRLLVANAGEYFLYGSHGGLNKTNRSDVDVAQMINERADEDHIAAVIGLAQSRPESQQAAIELGTRGIAVLGTGVSGQRMVEGDAPVSYFQLSPPDARTAAVMAAFARHSPRLRAFAEPSPGHSGPAAVVVFDPRDEYFSADLAHRFDADYRSTGPVHLVPYGEMEDGRRTRAVADTVCKLVHRTNGFVLYAGRSSVMEDLFPYMQHDRECRARRGRVAVLAQSPAPDLVLHPKTMAQQYGALALFYHQSSLPDPDGPFTKSFRAAFGLSAENDAGAGYDAVNILAVAMDAIFTTDRSFSPSALVTYLQDPGVREYVGESGVITLDGGHNYPPNKEIHIREITAEGTRVTDLTCGMLADGARSVTRWGPGGRFDCPVDDAS